MVLNLFSLNGVVNKVLGVLNVEPVIWFGESAYFRQLVVFTDVWKEFGFNAVIFMAALASVDPTYYEAAAIDGCSSGAQSLRSRCRVSHPRWWWSACLA